MRRLKAMIAAVVIVTLGLLTSCSKEKEYQQVLRLRYNSSRIEYDTEWRLVALGASEVTITPIKAKKEGLIDIKQYFKKDTLDAFLLFDEAGHLQLPLFVDTVDVRVEVNDTLFKLDGIRYADEIVEWQRALRNSDEDLSGSMMELITKLDRQKMAPIIILDLMNRFPETACLDALSPALRNAVYRFSGYDKLLGMPAGYFEGSSFSKGSRAPGQLHVIGDRDSLYMTRELMGEEPLMLLTFESALGLDSVELEERQAWHEVLDSLKIPSYHALLFADSLPGDLKVIEKSKRTPVWRYYLVDSVGAASRLAEETRIETLPSYILVDTLLYQWREWHSRDSVVNFINQMREGL
ncbi:MAG: hypothetical protein Q4D93_00820 [Porphyromonas sp.]|nr:hypothetical protein [Porphyromonas sp.]